MRSVHRLLTTVLVLAAAPSALGAADAPLGPQLGSLRYRTAVAPAGDVDDYLGRFAPGERLTVTVTAQAPARGAAPTLKPAITLVGPDGVERSVLTVASASATSVVLRDFVVPDVGDWTVRVRGAEDTTGEYVIGFATKPAARETLRDQSLGPSQERVHAFEAPAGGRLEAVLRWKRRTGPVGVLSLLDPDGDEVLGPGGVPLTGKLRARGDRLELRGVTLPAKTGTYGLRVVAHGDVRYEITLGVTAAPRASSRKVVPVPSSEPVLTALAEPLVASPGTTVRFAGANFTSKGGAPRVVFDRAAVAATAVAPDGTWLDAVVPPRSGPCVATVTVVNADGQGTRRPLHFAYLPAPSVSDLVDDATGAPLRDATTLGGRLVRVLGANFEEGHVVRVGSAAAADVACLGPTAFRFRLPPLSAGHQRVLVADSFGRSATSSFYVRGKLPPAVSAGAYTPPFVGVGVADTVTLRGTGFEATDRVLVDGVAVATTFVDAQTLEFAAPALAAGPHTIRVVDALGGTADAPDLVAKGAPVITSVAVVAGDVLAGPTVPPGGGSRVRIVGTDFLDADQVLVGDVEITSFLLRDATTKEFLAPPGSPGPVAVTVTDPAGQSATLDDAFGYAALDDASAGALPAATQTDDFSAARAAVADLDGDGAADDVVLVAPLAVSSGTRSERTRVLAGEDGALVDVTADTVPAAGSDPTGQDTWDATCLALGDVDGDDVVDVILGGAVAAGADVGQVRVLLNDGSGALSPARDQPGTRGLAELTADYTWTTYYYPYGYVTYTTTYTVADAAPQRGTPAALALGDVDADGDLDLFVGTDRGVAQTISYDLSYVDFTYDPPVMTYVVPVNVTQFLPATRLYENRLSDGEGFVDVSSDRLPSCGTDDASATPLPAFHCRDLAAADLDGDGDRDLVVAWDDPTTVSSAGLAQALANGQSYDAARIATRVLLNDGGAFSDATDTWMPAASTPEHWQARRLLLADVDADGDPDLLLATSGSLDAYAGGTSRSRRALRLLRNDGSGFTDVTSSRLPSPVAATGDDLRADALLLHDVDGDGVGDLVLSTTTSLATGAGSASPRLRVLFGRSGTSFVHGAAFAAAASVDTGEATDLVVVPDLGDEPLLLLVAPAAPGAGPAAHPRLRAQRWTR